MSISTASDPTIGDDLAPATAVSVERGLKFAAGVTVVTGLFFAVASTASTDGAVRQLLDLVFFRLGDGPDRLADSHHLGNAILGGVMVGWGVMVWLLTDRFLRRAPRDVKQILMVGLTCWFVVDSAGSIASGGWPNALLNVGFFGLFLVPLRKI